MSIMTVVVTMTTSTSRRSCGELTPSSTTHAERIAAVRERVRAAETAAGRPSGSVRIVAVAKTHPPRAVQDAVDAGIVDIGENRVAELLAKQVHVTGATWHLVGRLQTNKVRDVVGHVSLIHSVDTVALADAVSRRAVAAGLVQDVLVQVNVGDDPAKGGVDLAGAEGLVAYAVTLPNVRVTGLMTVPPLPSAGSDPVRSARPHFAALRALRDRLASMTEDITELSMGMSDDLEAAVAEGATMVRIGAALFGERGARPWQEDMV